MLSYYRTLMEASREETAYRQGLQHLWRYLRIKEPPRLERREAYKLLLNNTPSIKLILGDTLAQRLQQHDGVTIEQLDSDT